MPRRDRRLRRPTVDASTQTPLYGNPFRFRNRPTPQLRSAISAHGATQAYMKGHIHRFTRWTNTFNAVNSTNWNVTPTADTVDSSMFLFTSPASAGVSTAGIGFRLDDLQSESEFDNLFDFYRIRAVKLVFSFLFDNATIGGSLQAPMLYIVKDYDDNSVPASVGELIQYNNCKQIQIYNKSKGVHKVYLQPRVMNTTTYEQQPRYRKPWIDMAGDSSVVYHGVKFALVNRDASSVKIYVRAKYYFECKGQR